MVAFVLPHKLLDTKLINKICNWSNKIVQLIRPIKWDIFVVIGLKVYKKSYTIILNGQFLYKLTPSFILLYFWAWLTE